jgi:SET domain-containing protein 6
MMYEYLQGDSSPWSAYLRVLPESFDTPMFWSKTELKELQISSLKNKIGKSDADDMISTKVLPRLENYASVFYPPGVSRLSKKDALALAHRMGSTIMAYSFDLDNDDSDEELPDADDEWVEDRDGSMLGMVPMADILNADAEFNVSCSCCGASLKSIVC